MYFSNYKLWTWVLFVPLLILLFAGGYFLPGGSLGLGIALVLLGLLLVPLVAWQNARLQDRMDDYGGRFPLSAVWDWNIEDDRLDEDEEKAVYLQDPPPGATRPSIGSGGVTGLTLRCPQCGEVQPTERTLYCRRCGRELVV